MDKLFLFTSSFPYGNKETYLEKEVLVLAKSFKKVEVFPHYYNQKNFNKREVPSNVVVHRPAFPLNKYFRILLVFKSFFRKPKILIFVKDFFDFKVYHSKITFIRWLRGIIDYLSTIGSVQYYKIKNEEEVCFYFYWGIGWSYSLLNMRKDLNRLFFVRLHGGDSYLERANGYLPVRDQVYYKADYLLPISIHLRNYLKNKYNIQEEKIIASRLGVEIQEITKFDITNKLKLVSCSNLIPLKRVHKILEAIIEIKDLEIEWTHFGHGPEFNNIKNSIFKFEGSNLNINFLGSKSNIEILNFYENNEIDAFINVSKFEGIPVSIMEAMSFGIPCIATDAGATSELVNNKNGILLDKEFTRDELVNSIRMVKSENWRLKRILAYNHCKEFFNSEENYNFLVKNLKYLSTHV